MQFMDGELVAGENRYRELKLRSKVNLQTLGQLVSKYMVAFLNAEGGSLLLVWGMTVSSLFFATMYKLFLKLVCDATFRESQLLV